MPTTYSSNMDISSRKMNVSLTTTDPCTTLPKLASMDMLPNEIMVFIFDIIRISKDTYSFEQPFHPRRLCNISLVCKRWYNLILSTSTLWNAIYLPKEIYHSDSGRTSRICKALRMQLNRAGAAPLSLVMGYCSMPLLAQEIPNSPPLDCLRPFYPRFTSLDLSLHLSILPDFFGPSFFMPALTHLKLTVLDWSGLTCPRLRLDSHNVPQLAHVDLNLSRNYHSISLPWSQLITLKVESNCSTSDGSAFNLLTIMPELINIEQLSIRHGTPSDSLAHLRHKRNIALSSLQSLTFHMQSKHCLGPKLLQHMDVPSLQELSVSTVLLGPGTERLLYESLKGVRLSGLIALNLTLFAVNDAELLLGLLCGLNNLESLSLFVKEDTFTGVRMTHQLLQALGNGSVRLDVRNTRNGANANQLLQHLTSLELGNIPVIDVDQILRPLFQWLRADNPWEAGNYLRTVQLFVDGPGLDCDWRRNRLDLPKGRIVRPRVLNDATTMVQIIGGFGHNENVIREWTHWHP